LSAPILLSGATGLVGGRLSVRLEEHGQTVRALSRRPERLPRRASLEPAGWDGTAVPAAAVAGTGAIVHLSGEPIFGGFATTARRRRIRASRVDSTRHLVDALGELPADERPEVLVCASAVGYYGDRGEEELTESAGPGSGFLAQLCVDWEREAQRAADFGTRVASLRFGVVLSRDGGALAALGILFRLALGGRVGDGRQWFPWVHLDDAVGLVLRALEDTTWHGPVNAVAPGAVRNAEFTRSLARAVERPACIPVPAFALRAALGELSGELLGSRRVVPARARAAGFAFAHPALESALAAEFGREHDPEPGSAS
jgi:uncharacterized protein (TIGR01777 family)